LPLSPKEIATAKVLANGVVLMVATAVSLYFVVRLLLGVPVAGSIPLFMLGVALYLFYALAVGLFLATLVQSMPQFGLLFILVFLPMQMLSGGNTPLESEPRILQILMQGIATTHFVSFAQAILFRGAGLSLVFWDYLTVAVMGVLFFVLSVRRFRRASALATG
jgi:ABC-2 type transport system permease protein